MIDLSKKYRTRDGKEVELYAYKEGQEHPILGAVHYPNEWVETSWTTDGKFSSIADEVDDDLIEVSPYEDFKIDDPVLVSSNGKNWHKRHFAGVNRQNEPKAYEEGRTSFTAEDHMITIWNYCKRPDEKETHGNL